MRRVNYVQMIILLMCLVLWAGNTTLWGQFAGGTGTAADPWQITTPTHLNTIRNYLGTAHSDKHFIQRNNLDLGVEPWNQGTGWQPIGTEPEANNNRFTGNYDGAGYVISNLYINRENASAQGLFGYAHNAVLRNIILADIDIRAGGSLGGLLGIQNNSRVIKCSSSGTITGSSSGVGGLVGNMQGTADASFIENSHSRTNVTGSANTGGLVGFVGGGNILASWASGNVAAEHSLGGLVGLYFANNTIRNCYARGNVTALQSQAGGLIGMTLSQQALFENCYATGRVSAEGGGAHLGGLIGIILMEGTVTNSYWDIESSGMQFSAGGIGRQTRQMTYPYDQQTYSNWDFRNMWVADSTLIVNEGYPYLFHHPQEPVAYPYVAINPQPQNLAANISVFLTTLSWEYIEHPLFASPLGFRVYMNITGDFEEDDPFVWVPYIENQTNYHTSDILPERLFYATTHYWKVVPTTTEPDERRESERGRRKDTARANSESALLMRGDAQNVPVWRFTTQRNPLPTVAVSPQPADEAIDVSVNLVEVGWTFNQDPAYDNPIGFRVYLNTTGDFTEEDYTWVAFSPHQSNYRSANVLPNELAYAQTYYWQVVPTTTQPGRRGEYYSPERRRRSDRDGRIIFAPTRGDAEEVPVWSFNTISINPYPQPATNPSPAHLAEGVSLDLDRLTWDYIADEFYQDPVGFRIYVNYSGAFPPNAPYCWVDYEPGQVTYSCSDILHGFLYPETEIYWRVIPTTNFPNAKQTDSYHKRTGKRNIQSEMLHRGDAINFRTWRFFTGSTNIEEETDLISVTKLISAYPNPFNPKTTIRYDIKEEAYVELIIFDVQGKLIKKLVDDFQREGEYRIVWDGKDDDGIQKASGVYFYRLKTTDYDRTEKMLMVK